MEEYSRFKSLGKGADDYISSRDGSGQGQSGQSDILKHAKIGKFGEMVLNKSSVSFRCRATPIVEIRTQKRSTPFLFLSAFFLNALIISDIYEN
jgi:hypothetical protein